LHVSVEVPDEPAVRVTAAGALQDRPAEGFAVKVTVPAKLFTDVTVIVEEPEFVARILAGETVPRETVKVGATPTVTETGAVLDSVLGLVPVVPVMVKVKVEGLGTLVQLTVRVVPETLAVQPVGAALVENVTVPVKPLIATKDSADVFGVPTTTLSEAGFADTVKS